MTPGTSILPLLFLSLLFTFKPSVSETPVTCTAPLAVLGRPTHLTCYFQNDVNANRNQIVIIRHAFGAPYDDLGKDVLTCIWPIQANEPLCKAKKGYSFDGNISDRLTLNIDSATNETAGQYACHVVPPDGTAVYRCALAVEEKEERPPANLQVDSRQIGETTSKPDADLQPDGSSATVTILGVIVGFLIPCVVLMAALLLYRYKRVSKNQPMRPDSPGSDSPLLTKDVEKCSVLEEAGKATRESGTQTG